MDAFNKANPGIVVKEEPQSWTEIYAKAPAAIAAGTGPDILFGIPDFTTVISKVAKIDSVADFVKDSTRSTTSCRRPWRPIPMAAAFGPCRCTTWRCRCGTAKACWRRPA